MTDIETKGRVRVGKIDPRRSFRIYNWKFPGGYTKCTMHDLRDCTDCKEYNIEKEKKRIKGEDRTYYWVHYKGEKDPIWLQHKKEIMEANGHGWWWYIGRR